MNKVETKVELRFDLANSLALDEAEKHLAATRLENRLTKDGILIITNQTTRSQLDNKEAATEEFFRLLEWATTPPKKRKKVKPLTANREVRLSRKRLHSEKKSMRQKVSFWEEGDLCFF